jgi:hypothetical protein
MLDVLVQHGRKVARSGDQQVVEAFAAQRADPAVRNGVCARCSHRGAEDADVGAGEYSVEGGGVLGISVADQELELLGAVAEVHEQVAGLLVTHAPVGRAVIPAMCTRRRPCSITTGT